MRSPSSLGLAGLLLVASAGVAAAHEVGGSRFDAPLPLPLLFLGAAATVAVTAGWLALWGGSAAPVVPRRVELTIPPPLARGGRLVGRTAFLVAFLLALVIGLAGPQVAAENFATVFVWPLWLKGVALLSALVGSPWRVLSPWQALYDGLRRLEGGEIAVLGRYPPWLGAWPALVGFLLWIGVAENLTGVPRSPAATTLLVAGYACVTLLGAIAFGAAWLERADALAVLYRLFGRVAPLEVSRTTTGGYSVRLRYPWQACSRSVRGTAVAAFVVATVYTVSFDGFTSTPEYQTLHFALRDVTTPGPTAGFGLYVAGYLLFVGLFAGVIALADRAGGRRDVRGALLAFAPTVLPIAVAYEVAHNYPFVARSLGQLPVVLGRYLGADPTPVEPLAWLSLPTFWASQVFIVVLGHVVAVIAAHAVTVRRYPSPRSATVAHVPLTALMVGYTVLSLWIISRPLVS